MQADAAWKSRRTRRYDCEKDLKRAVARYEKGRYNETKTILSETKYQCAGHSAMDSILYYLGMSQLRSKSPVEARTEFNRLVIDFPNSPFAEEAHFRIGHASYLASNPPERDQSKTKDAIRELEEFIDRHPQSVFADSARKYIEKCEEKLAYKEFQTGRFYQKIEKYEAAIVYYRALVEEYAHSRYAEESILSMAYSLAKVQRRAEARQVLEQLLEKQPTGEVAKKARSLIARLDRIAEEKPRFRLFREKEEIPPESDKSLPENLQKYGPEESAGTTEDNRKGMGGEHSGRGQAAGQQTPSDSADQSFESQPASGASDR